MSVKIRVDRQVIQMLCERLGIEYETTAENRDLRDEVLQCLSMNLESLERLAERGSISLYDLSINKLVPSPLRNHIFGYTPREKATCDGRNEGFHKEVGSLTEKECHQFSSFDLIGEKSISTILVLADLHRQTSGFRTLLAKPLSATEELALLGRIRNGISTDAIIQRRLFAMFPPAAPQ